MAADTTTASELTAEQVQSILVRPLEDASQFLAAGPRIFDTDGNQIRIPKLGATDAPSWHAENEQIDEVDQAFDEIVLLPSTMKSVKTLTRYSNELARQSVIALDATLRERLVRGVADKLDNAFISGDGGTPAGTEPVGLLNYSGTQGVDVSGLLALDDLIDAWGLALAANVNMAGLRWWMRPETFTGLRKLKDLDNRYQLQPDPTQDGVFRLFGAPVTVTSRIPVDGTDTTVVLADFSQIAVARDQSPTVKLLDQTYGDYDQMAIRVTARYDAAPMNPEAVVLLTDVDTDGDSGKLTMSAPTLMDLELFLGQPVGAAEAMSALQTMTHFTRAYTRGRGFTDGVPADDISAVIVTATARLMANPQGTYSESVGDFAVQYGKFQGFNLLELAVLNNYRRTAA